jgi:hypothetical protein
MPHQDIGVDLNDYLAALNKYNVAYGPQPQGVDSTGGQNFAIRSSTEAPGFGYVNPENNELFPLYPEGTTNPALGGLSGTAGQFHEYLQSIGAKKQDIGYGVLADEMKRFPRFGFSQRAYNESGKKGGYTVDGQSYRESRGRTDYGAGVVPAAPYKIGEHTTGGHGQRYGFVGPQGGFIGYGNDTEELFASSPILRRDYYDSLYGSNAPPVEGV